MKFRGSTTYNTKDTVCRVGGERIEVDHGVKKRCELVLRAVLRHESITTEQCTDHLNKRFNCLYSTSDVLYALRRLNREGLITMPKFGVWTGTQNALAVWKSLPKEYV